MIISRIILKNWRNFSSVEVELGQRTFLVGPNASGKSNFLDVFRFLRDIAKSGGGLQRAVSNREGLSKIRCLSARKNPVLEIEVHFSENQGDSAILRYALGIIQETRGYRQPLLRYERVWSGKELIVDRPDKSDTEDPMRLTQTYLEQINANASFREVSRFFEEITYLHLIPQLLRFPDVFGSNGISGDPFGRNFLEKVARTPEKTRNSRLKKIEKALQYAVPQLKQLSLKRDDRGVPHLEALYEHWRPKAGKQKEDQFSDGTLRLMALLWVLLEGDTLLLLEEPELSLHSAVVSTLPSIMHRILKKKKRQIILSTHSENLLIDRSIGLEEILLLTPGPEGTVVEKASKRDEIKALLEGGMTIPEAVFPGTAPSNIQQLEYFNWDS